MSNILLIHLIVKLTNILQYPKEINRTFHFGHRKVVMGTLSHGIWSPMLLNRLIYTFTKRLLKATFALFRAKLGIYFDSEQVWGGREIILRSWRHPIGHSD